MYVNSWVPSDKVKNGEVSAFPQLMVDQLIKVIEAYNAKQTDDQKLSYYINQKYIRIYGKPCFDTFNFSIEQEDDVNQRIGIDSWRFCKTCREPYDVVIKVFLSVLQHHGMITSWDHGDNSRCPEYQAARRLAKKLGIEWHGSRTVK